MATASEGTTIEVRGQYGVEGSLQLGQFYEWLSRNLLTEEQLKDHHYPRPHPYSTSKAKLYNLPHKFVPAIRQQRQRLCRCCFKKYQVDGSGNEVGYNVCNYHPNSRPPPNQPYVCCGRERMAPPCSTRLFHVTKDIDPENLNNFLSTKKLANNDTTMYALDCEFVHTRLGLELAAVTIVDHNERKVLDTCVQPLNPIIDYLPQFSHLSESNFKSNSITNTEFREKLREILGPNVILIGHSLHGDLLKMNVIHDKVIDTALLFPHPDGKDYLPSLKMLARQHLGEDEVTGHTSKAYQDSVLTLRLAKLLAWKKIMSI